MNIQVLGTVLFLSLANTVAAENRIYQTDKYGNIEYNKPSYTVQDNGRIVETDKFGNKQYHKDQWQIQGDKTSLSITTAMCCPKNRHLRSKTTNLIMLEYS